MIRQVFVADYGFLECDIGASREGWGLQKTSLRIHPMNWDSNHLCPEY